MFSFSSSSRAHSQKSNRMLAIIIGVLFILFLFYLLVRRSSSYSSQSGEDAPLQGISLVESYERFLSPELRQYILDIAQSISNQQTVQNYFTTTGVIRSYYQQLQHRSDNSVCNVLIFGLGRDTPFYLMANDRGRTIFIENDAEWIARTPLPDVVQSRASVVQYTYQTQLKDSMNLLNDPNRHEKLFMSSLPKDILLSTDWDVIIVDAPFGMETALMDAPGRMMSIYTASLLAHQGRPRTVHVFVHDYDRVVERTYADRLLQLHNRVSVVDRLAHFRIQHP
eukprot:TRINITY_DN163_c0_g1_i1.p1 TRINITY_DN163_c0_g1~~TRINITY_DN163_c0_g1_i1.p1  ORF type:complete len:281 (+),score=53.51 TRINITY_DN163_c0_g1_i1:72-914(+)